MSWCNKGIKSSDVYKMDEADLNSTLDKCEEFCNRYTGCDTVVLMNDELMVMRGEKLKCPYCKTIFGDADCPDLFASEEDEELIKQEKLLQEMWKAGYNVVTCGDCGGVFIHRT